VGDEVMRHEGSAACRAPVGGEFGQGGRRCFSHGWPAEHEHEHAGDDLAHPEYEGWLKWPSPVVAIAGITRLSVPVRRFQAVHPPQHGRMTDSNSAHRDRRTAGLSSYGCTGEAPVSVGSASWPLYDFANLARKNDLVVSVNHRLGILGFLDLSPRRSRGTGDPAIRFCQILA